ncbi:MAG: GNAT family N-acetyltransferase [Butyricicoccus sp.]|nr:GNAT family N-acetyltransferase [Butyricicoccus sp.]
MDIRFVLPEEVRQLQRNVLTAFPSKTPASLLQNMESELYQPDEGRYLGCFDDTGTLIGSILMMDFTLNVRGVMMPMGAAAYVSTHFLHKKEHIARNMLRVLMGYYTKLGTTVGCLHPFNPAFYRKMGYGHCMEAYFYMPKASEIRSFGHKEGLCYAEEGDREEVLAYYRAYAERTNGATVHPYMDPHRIFDMPYVVLCRRQSRITGYLTFEFVEVDHYTDMYHDLCVREMIYDDLDTLQQFLTFFASQVDQIDRVRIYSPDPYLHTMFRNPDSGENRAHDGCIHEIGRRTMGNMIRLFDVAGYFAVQTHACAPASRPFTLALALTDTFLTQNNRTFWLRIEGDSVHLIPEGAADVTLWADISDFSSLVIGAIPLADFVRLGRIRLSDPAYLRDIQRAIGWDVKPCNYTYF